jgi:hypothetical protein
VDDFTGIRMVRPILFLAVWGLVIAATFGWRNK